MDKRRLMQVPMRSATDQDLERVALTQARTAFCAIRLLDDEILAVSLYNRQDLISGQRMPLFCTYLQQDSYITKPRADSGFKGKWLTGRLYALVPSDNITLFDTESLTALRAFLGNEDADLRSLHRFQSQICDDRLRARHKRIMDRIDARMAIIPSVPPDFEHYIDREVLTARYAFYRRNRNGTATALCTSCHENVTLAKPKHNQNENCPNCGAELMMKCNGYAKGGIQDHGSLCLPQRTSRGFALRYFDVKRTILPEGTVQVEWEEYVRALFENGKGHTYCFKRFLSTGVLRWCEEPSFIAADPRSFYPTDYSELTKGTAWQYSAAHLYHKIPSRGWNTSIHRFLSRYLERPYIEYLLKQGLYRLCSEAVYGHFEAQEGARTLQAMLKVNRTSLSLLSEIDATKDELHMVQFLNQHHLSFTAEQVRIATSHFFYRLENLTELLTLAPLNAILEYAKGTPDTHMWHDYLSMAKELGYDLKQRSLLFPKELNKAHDAVTLLHRRKQARAREAEFKEIADSLKHYEWSPDSGDFVIVAPKCASDIVNEGSKLHHCVHSYIPKVINQSCAIMFLRQADKPNKPYVTLEISNYKIRQAKAFGNAKPGKPALDFLKKYGARLQQTDNAA